MQTETGAFLPFGEISTPGQVIEGKLKASGVIYRCNPDGSDLDASILLHVERVRTSFDDDIALARERGGCGHECAHHREGRLDPARPDLGPAGVTRIRCDDHRVVREIRLEDSHIRALPGAEETRVQGSDLRRHRDFSRDRRCGPWCGHGYGPQVRSGTRRQGQGAEYRHERGGQPGICTHGEYLLSGWILRLWRPAGRATRGQWAATA